MTENDFFGGALFSGLVAGIFDKDARRDDGLELGFEHGNGIRNPSASIDGLGPRLKTGVILGHKGLDFDPAEFLASTNHHVTLNYLNFVFDPFENCPKFSFDPIELLSGINDPLTLN